MRYFIYGSGAVGGTIGARLHLAGREVTLIARGAHLEAIRKKGLSFVDPEGEHNLKIPVIGSPKESEISAGDVVILCMKSQDTQEALDVLSFVTGPETPIVCAQNGVNNERLAIRYFQNVYGMLVVLPVSHLEPGEVVASSAPITGILDLGRFPNGVDDICKGVASDLRDASFRSEARQEIMPWKYTKLIRNLFNAVDAILGLEGDVDAEIRQDFSTLLQRAREEGDACLAAAGIDRVSDEAFLERFKTFSAVSREGAAARQGSSSWQSLKRGTGSVEAGYLNGEIVMLGRLFGIATPVNLALQETVERLAHEGISPGSLTLADINFN